MKYELIAGEWGDLSTYLFRVDDDGSKTEIGSDFGEPEDNSFYRDWSFVPEELNKLAAERDRLREQLATAKRQRDEAVTLLEECVAFVAARISVWELDSGGRKHEPARELLAKIGKVLGKEFRV